MSAPTGDGDGDGSRGMTAIGAYGDMGQPKTWARRGWVVAGARSAVMTAGGVVGSDGGRDAAARWGMHLCGW